MRRSSSNSLAAALIPLSFVLSAASGCLYFEPWVYCASDEDCGAGGICVVDPERGSRCLLDGEDITDFPRDAGHHGDAGFVIDSGALEDAGSLPDGGAPVDDAGESPDAGDPGNDAGQIDAGDVDGGTVIPPTAPGVSIQPSSPVTGDDLTLQIDEESMSSHPVSYTIAWLREGANQAELAGLSTVPAALTTKGESWTVVVTPTAGGVDGEAGEAAVTIGNTPPSLSGVAVYPLKPRPGELARAIPIGWSDPDPGDTQFVQYAWKGEATAGVIDLGSASTLQFPLANDVVRYWVELTPKNGPASPTPGETEASCPRTSTPNSARWRLHYPPLLNGMNILAASSMLDSARDRLLLGADLFGRYKASSFEFSLAADTPWHQLDVTPPEGEALLTAQLVMPERDEVLRFGGQDKDTGTISDVAGLLSLGHGCEEWRVIAPTGAPALSGPSLVWDSRRQRALALFGRAPVSPGPVDNTAVYALDLTAGEEGFLTLAAADNTLEGLTGRMIAYAGYDAARDRVVVYGGLATGFNAALADVLTLSLDVNPPVWRSVQKAGAPAARIGAGVSLWPAGDALVVVGGCVVGVDLQDCDDAANDDVFILDLEPGAEAWTASTLAIPLDGDVVGFDHHPRRGTFLALVARNDPTPPTDEILLYEITPGTPTWSVEVLWDGRDGAPAGRGHHGSTLLAQGEGEPGDPVVFYGGVYDTNDDEEHFDDAWRWDASEGRWIAIAATTPRPSPRSSFAYAEGDFSWDAETPGPPIFLAGGRCDSGGTPALCDDVWRATWSGSELLWTPGPSGVPKPEARAGAAGALVSGEPYPAFRAYGGRLGNDDVVAEDWSFIGAGQVSSFENGTWTLNTGIAWPALFDAALVSSPFSNGNRAYLVGGRNISGVAQEGMWVSDLYLDTDGEWAPVAFEGDGTLPARGGASATLVALGTLLVYGGEEPGGKLDDVWILTCLDENDPQKCFSYDVSATIEGGPPVARAHHSARYDRETDTLWIFGGHGGGDDGTPRELWSLAPVVGNLVP